MRRWFAGGPAEIGTAAPRVDRYLRGAGAALGIKLREGGVEVKQRQQPGEPQQFAPRAAGQVESWVKWRFPLSGEGDAAGITAAGDAAWLPVHKVRLLQTVAIGEDGGLTAVSPGSLPPRGCDWELTQVHAAGAAWWTTGLEAFGSQMPANLHALAAAIFAQELPHPLPPQAALGYPAWLTQL